MHACIWGLSTAAMNVFIAIRYFLHGVAATTSLSEMYVVFYNSPIMRVLCCCGPGYCYYASLVTLFHIVKENKRLNYFVFLSVFDSRTGLIIIWLLTLFLMYSLAICFGVSEVEQREARRRWNRHDAEPSHYDTPLTKVTKHKQIRSSALFELHRVRSFFRTFFILADEVLPW
jgi:hypothetical protein